MKRTGLVALMMAVLSGCNAPMMMAPGRTAVPGAQGKVGSAALSMDDTEAVIINRTWAAAKAIQSSLPAILVSPTDVIAQRALQNVFSTAISQVAPGIDLSIDDAVANEVIASTKLESPPVEKPELQAYLQGIANRLAKAAQCKPFKVHVVQIPEANAFNAGGNQMVVFTGLLTSVQDESELAGVMAHEMVHGLRRHMVKNQVRSNAADIALMAVAKAQPVPAEEQKLMEAFMLSLPARQVRDHDFMLGYLQGKIGQAAMTNFKFEVNSYFASQTINRSYEAESDTFGVRIVSNAGYDPYGMVRTFDRWNDYPNSDTRYYTHPDLGQRVASLRNQINEEGLAAGEKERGEERFKKAVSVLNPTPNTVADLSPTVAKHLCWHRVEAFEPQILKAAKGKKTPASPVMNRQANNVSALRVRR